MAFAVIVLAVSYSRMESSAPFSLSELASRCERSATAERPGRVEIEGNWVFKNEEVRIHEQCEIVLAGGASLGLRNVDIVSKDLAITNSKSSRSSSVDIRNSVMKAVEPAELFIRLTGVTNSILIERTTLEYAALLISPSDKSPSRSGGARVKVLDSQVKAVAELTAGQPIEKEGSGLPRVMILASHANGVMELRKVNFEVEGEDEVLLLADKCSMEQVTGVSLRSCSRRPPAKKADKMVAVQVETDRMRPEGLFTYANGNGVMELGETALVEPHWKNPGEVSVGLKGKLISFTGPKGFEYRVIERSAEYGSLGIEETGSCLDAQSCYILGVSSRTGSAKDVEARLTERLSNGQTKVWRVPIKASGALATAWLSPDGTPELDRTVLVTQNIHGLEWRLIAFSTPDVREQSVMTECLKAEAYTAESSVGEVQTCGPVRLENRFRIIGSGSINDRKRDSNYMVLFGEAGPGTAAIKGGTTKFTLPNSTQPMWLLIVPEERSFGIVEALDSNGSVLSSVPVPAERRGGELDRFRK